MVNYIAAPSVMFSGHSTSELMRNYKTQCYGVVGLHSTIPPDAAIAEGNRRNQVFVHAATIICGPRSRYA